MNSILCPAHTPNTAKWSQCPNETHVFCTFEASEETTIALGRYCGHAVAHCSLHVAMKWFVSYFAGTGSTLFKNWNELCIQLLLLPSFVPDDCSSLSICSTLFAQLSLWRVDLFGFSSLFMFLCLHIAYNSVFVDIYAYLIAFNGQQEATRAHSQNLSKISIATTEYSYAENDRWIVVWIVTCVERVPAILTPLDYCWQRGSTHFALSRHKS